MGKGEPVLKKYQEKTTCRRVKFGPFGATYFKGYGQVEVDLEGPYAGLSLEIFRPCVYGDLTASLGMTKLETAATFKFLQRLPVPTLWLHLAFVGVKLSLTLAPKYAR